MAEASQAILSERQRRWLDVLLPLATLAVALIVIDLLALSRQFVTQLGSFALLIQGPLQGLAVASVGIFANMIFVIFLSLFIVEERDSLEAFLIRLIPPAHAEEVRLFETSVSRSF